MLYNLLNFVALPDDATDTFELISIITLALTIIVTLLLARFSKKLNTKKLTISAMLISLSFVLSFIKIKIAPQGGSVTLLSMVPVLLACYFGGFSLGLFIGFVFAILQFISSPWVLTIETFLLDYILAYTAICLAPSFKKIVKNQTVGLLLGTLLVYVIRIICHVLSGMIIFSFGIISDGFPVDNAFIYSFIYNITYLVPDMILSMIGLVFISKSQIIKTVEKQFISI